MPMTKSALNTLTLNCKGACDECTRSDICEIYRNFMFEACDDWETHQVEEIMELFGDPDKVDKLEKEVLG